MTSHMEKVWINRYLVHFNAKRAAEEAGYKWPRRVGYQKKQKFADEIEARLEEMVMTADEALARISKTARADYSKYVKDYGPVKGIDVQAMIDDDLGDLIREIYQTKEGPRVKLADPDWAQELVLKHQTKGASGTKDDPIHLDINNARERLTRDLDSIASRIGAEQADTESE